MLLKKILTAGLLSLFSISVANADSLGFRVGTGVWQPGIDGTFQFNGTNISLANDLLLKGDENQDYVYAVFEHPIPLIPNVKVSQTSLGFDGAGTITASYTFGGTTYSASTAVTTEMVLDHTDTTIYWSLLDNWIHFDFGLTAKLIDGYATVNGNRTPIEGTIPMGYFAVGFELPFFENLFVGFESNALDIGDHSIKDTVAKISYTTDYMLGVEVGVRTFTVELGNLDGNYSNMEFSGSFANVYFHF